ncbi:iron complex outermembrane receptor protein [Litorivivens lipolytica]|uniref:Iron complex outermembrane receptor protein n=1 Tax=Litorivivens lipolytica TaxID=1524264 RepID=A0A7W4W692_9GAMM|nr:TonB-dependent receptor [Litorivivens lipolytica]MBB3048278.1 iron complex outermembrane receptor protein [Litorivivens lipolytica]
MKTKSLWAASLIASSLPVWAGDKHIEEIVVSAPLGKAAADTALPIGVLSGEALRQEAAASLGETLSNEIGVHSASFGSGVGNPVIRGQGGNRVRVLQDGIGTLDAADVSPDHSYAAEPLLAERIEIIRGPATLLYGNGAIGGVINVIDKRIPESVPATLNGAFEVRHATVNDQDSSVFSLDGGAGQFAWHMDGLYRESNNLDIPGVAIDLDALRAAGEEELPEENTRGYIGNSDKRSDAWTVGGSWIGERGFVGLSFNRANNNYGLPPGAHEEHEHDAGAGAGAGAGAAEEEHHESNIRLDMEQDRVDLKAGLELDGFFQQLDLRLSHNDYQHKELEESDEGTEVGTVFENKAHEGRLVMRHQPLGNWRGAIGLQLGDRDFSAVGEEAFIPPADITHHALFLVEELSLDRWTYEFGLRGEQQRIDIGDCKDERDTLSASASALWNFRDDSNAMFALNRSERAPTVEELYSNSQNCARASNLNEAVEHAATARIEVGDPELDKELSHNFELGLRKTAGPVTAELSLYYNEIQNYTYLQDTGAEVDEVKVANFSQRNAAFSGYEFQIGLPLPLIHKNLSVEVFSDYTRARFTEGDGDVPRIPAQRFGSALHYHAGNWSTHLRLTQVREQDRVADNENATPAYTLLEFAGDYHLSLGKGEMTLFVKARNLLDEEVRNHTSLLKNFAPEAGRNIESGVRYTF